MSEQLTAAFCRDKLADIILFVSEQNDIIQQLESQNNELKRDIKVLRDAYNRMSTNYADLKR